MPENLHLTDSHHLLSADPIHRLVLEMRYALESAGRRIEGSDHTRGQEVEAIASSLPYLWSGGRDVPMLDAVAGYEKTARAIACKYGVGLPTNRKESVPVLLAIAAYLLDPHPNLRLEWLQQKYPIAAPSGTGTDSVSSTSGLR